MTKCHISYTKTYTNDKTVKSMAKSLTQAQRAELSGLHRQREQLDHGLVARGPGTVARQTRIGHCQEHDPEARVD